MRLFSAPYPTLSVITPWPASRALAGYTVLWGTESGTHTSSLDAGSMLTATVTGLTSGRLYFFVVAARDKTGAMSCDTNEVSGIAP